MIKIGNIELKSPFILAPMAGVSQMPFRSIALEYGAGLAPTELISAKGLFYKSVRTKLYLTRNEKIERPFCVQLFGGDEESMSKAARIAMENGADIIDINMGCPVKKVTKSGAGSSLLCDIKRSQNLILAMRKAVGDKIPITVKIRSGWDQKNLNFLEVGKGLQDVGISAIAIHPRSRSQGYSGKANWHHIAELKNCLSIPVIGNGDVISVDCANKMFKQTGCDAVMIGRGALGNPWLFKKLLGKAKNISLDGKERLGLIRRHFNEHIAMQLYIIKEQQQTLKNKHSKQQKQTQTWQKQYNLEIKEAISPYGKMTALAGKYEGLKIKDARNKVKGRKIIEPRT